MWSNKSDSCRSGSELTTSQQKMDTRGGTANGALSISRQSNEKALWKVCSLKWRVGWMCQADFALSEVQAVGGMAQSCLPMRSHSVVTWDTSPHLRWDSSPKMPPTTHAIMLLGSVYVQQINPEGKLQMILILHNRMQTFTINSEGGSFIPVWIGVMSTPGFVSSVTQGFALLRVYWGVLTAHASAWHKHTTKVKTRGHEKKKEITVTADVMLWY